MLIPRFALAGFDFRDHSRLHRIAKRLMGGHVSEKQDPLVVCHDTRGREEEERPQFRRSHRDHAGQLGVLTHIPRLERGGIGKELQDRKSTPQ